MRKREEIIAAIAAERQRQVEREGWTPEHDDRHDSGELAEAAACYAVPRPLYWHLEPDGTSPVRHSFVDLWPWARERDKRGKHERIRQLEIAAALIVAELERLERSR